MESRKITVVVSKTNQKVVIMSSATTLGELKADLRANNIDYSGVGFFEGVSRTELKVDESILPTNVPYRGTITNELVFMLTPNKKIESGAGNVRAEAYAQINELGLKDVIVAKYGKNYTNCTTSELVETIEEYQAANTKPEVVSVSSNIEAAFRKLVEILEDYDTIWKSDKEEILSLIGSTSVVNKVPSTPKIESPYNEDEVDDMFDFLG